MTNDDDMREIEDAVGTFGAMCHARVADQVPARDRLLALIRQKLPQTDAEHERAVEAWLDRAHFVNGSYLVSGEDIDEALRLMRARPATCKDGLQAQAAGELLRVCKGMIGDEDYCYPDTLPKAIEAAERAGVR